VIFQTQLSIMLLVYVILLSVDDEFHLQES